MLGIRSKSTIQTTNPIISTAATLDSDDKQTPKKPRIDALAGARGHTILSQNADTLSPLDKPLQTRVKAMDSTKAEFVEKNDANTHIDVQNSSVKNHSVSVDISLDVRNVNFQNALMNFTQSPTLLHDWLKEFSGSLNDEIIQVQASNKTAGPLTKLNLGNPVYYASVLGMDEALSVLLDAGCDPNYRHPSGDTAILHCVEQGYDDCMKVFLDHAQSIDFKSHTTQSRRFHLGQSVTIDQEGGLNVLGAAIKNLREDIVSLLVTQPNAQELLNQKDQFGRNAKQQTTDLLKLCEKNSPRQKILLSINHGQIVPNDQVQAAESIESIKDQEKKRIQKIRDQAAQVERQNKVEVINKALAKVEKNYNRLHPEIYNLKNALKTVDCSVVTLTKVDKPEQSVYAFPLIEPKLCQKIFEEITHYEKQAITHSELELPLHTRHDGNLGELENCGFKPLLEDILKACMPVVNKQIAQEKQLAEGDWSDRVEVSHAFLTRNHPTAEKTFKIHRDKSDYTLNLCLHASNDLEGSTVGFYHERQSSEKMADAQPEDSDRAFTYKHQVGSVAFHSGKVWHRTDAITQGSRASLILWLKAKN